MNMCARIRMEVIPFPLPPKEDSPPLFSRLNAEEGAKSFGLQREGGTPLLLLLSVHEAACYTRAKNSSERNMRYASSEFSTL